MTHQARIFALANVVKIIIFCYSEKLNKELLKPKPDYTERQSFSIIGIARAIRRNVMLTKSHRTSQNIDK